MPFRKFSASVLVAGALLLAGCTHDTPEPTPTPLFATEQEAFAAAEETYRSYVDALNARRAGDKDADPEKFLRGDALRSERLVADQLADRSWRIEGRNSLIRFVPVHAELGANTTTVEANVCIDLSRTRVVDSDEQDVTPLDRADRASLAVSFESHSTLIRISASDAGGDACSE